MLLRAVRVQEFTRNIDDLFAVPLHDKTGGFSHDGDFRCLKIFRIRKGKEPVRILFRDNDSHSLLRFAYRKLGPVKSLIFFRHGAKVDMQPVGKGGELPAAGIVRHVDDIVVHVPPPGTEKRPCSLVRTGAKTTPRYHPDSAVARPLSRPVTGAPRAAHRGRLGSGCRCAVPNGLALSPSRSGRHLRLIFVSADLEYSVILPRFLPLSTIYSTVTDLARFRGLSMSQPRSSAM